MNFKAIFLVRWTHCEFVLSAKLKTRKTGKEGNRQKGEEEQIRRGAFMEPKRKENKRHQAATLQIYKTERTWSFKDG
jgi:hypothetical protein